MASMYSKRVVMFNPGPGACMVCRQESKKHMRIAILGNSGSGKSTLARRLAEKNGLPVLELDAIVWEPGKIAVMRAPEEVAADLEGFLARNASWVVEGCYGELIEKVLPACTELVFLNPGEAVCIENNRKRPWEPHKYDSDEAQRSMLENLLAWVRGYYDRDDPWSLSAHRRIFDAYAGRKREVTRLVDGVDL